MTDQFETSLTTQAGSLVEKLDQHRVELLLDLFHNARILLFLLKVKHIQTINTFASVCQSMNESHVFY